MSARTDALMSRQEAGKTAASIVSVMAGCHPARACINTRAGVCFLSFPKKTSARGAQDKRVDFQEHSSL
jgi:hypothetical protein